jgi:hypothetical protein
MKRRARDFRAIRTFQSALLLVLALGNAARAADSLPSLEDLYQWGEYDSLIRYLEPWLAARSDGADARADSVELARANLFLGVAYWVTDKKSLGEQAFVRACRLDAGLRMDQMYSTPEILSRFEAIAAGERRVRENQVEAERARRVESDRRLQDRRKAALWKRWTLGALGTAGLVVGSGYAYYALVERKPKVREIPVSPSQPAE